MLFSLGVPAADPAAWCGAAGLVPSFDLAARVSLAIGHPASRFFALFFDQSSTSIFAPQGTPARSIFNVSILVLAICTAIFLTVGGLLLYVLIRYRHRRGYTQREPAQIYGSTQVELSWTVIPILIVVVLFLATARVIFVTQTAAKPSTALDVVVIGHQYWWEYRYPKLGVVTANELHIPVSDPNHPTPTYLTMSSADTDHSFWIPRLAGKMDVIPNKVNVMWIDPEKQGLYLGQCAQYCGTQHAKMLLRVYADSPDAFSAWIKQQQQSAFQNPSVAAGRAVFEGNACVNCHTISGTAAHGTFGPNLSHLASRDTIASGSVPNNPQNLRAFIDDPAHFKPGALMPAMHLNDRDLDAVTQYLSTLH
jgi:cytochrome c oxidase subunit II